MLAKYKNVLSITYIYKQQYLTFNKLTVENLKIIPKLRKKLSLKGSNQYPLSSPLQKGKWKEYG